MVHGFLGHPGMFIPLERRLRAEGFHLTQRLSYPSTQLSLEQICDRIAASAKALAHEGPVDLVGHSLGAVACRTWLKQLGGAPFVRRFVSLGGPHAGTSLYRLVPPWLRPALSPRGRWAELNALGEEPVPTTVIRAAYDHQVFPPRRAAIAGVEEIVLARYGHNGILHAPAAHDAVVAALTRP
jgi:alpha-beta hydrolase superfamily lysophospholipase